MTLPMFELVGKVTSSHPNDDGTTTITGIELTSLSLSQDGSRAIQDFTQRPITVEELANIADQPKGQRERENRRLFQGSCDAW